MTLHSVLSFCATSYHRCVFEILLPNTRFNREDEHNEHPLSITTYTKVTINDVWETRQSSKSHCSLILTFENCLILDIYPQTPAWNISSI